LLPGRAEVMLGPLVRTLRTPVGPAAARMERHGEERMKNLYLLLAVVGAIVPWIFFADQIRAEGLDLGAFVRALFANGAAGGFSADLLISSLVFWIFMASARTPRIWIYVLLNLAIGLSCALPAYLYARARSQPAVGPHAAGPGNGGRNGGRIDDPA